MALIHFLGNIWSNIGKSSNDMNQCCSEATTILDLAHTTLSHYQWELIDNEIITSITLKSFSDLHSELGHRLCSMWWIYLGDFRTLLILNIFYLNPTIIINYYKYREPAFIVYYQERNCSIEKRVTIQSRKFEI